MPFISSTDESPSIKLLNRIGVFTSNENLKDSIKIMKKKILSLALAAITLASFNSMAQTPDNAAAQQTENVGTRGRDIKKGPKMQNPFEGLDLTDAQKDQLKALREKRAAERKARFEAMKQQKEAGDRKRMERKSFNDSTRMAERKKYLEEVKAIVGPDNYVIFLENFYMNNQQMPTGRPGKDFRSGDRDRRMDFNGAKMSKSDRKAAKADRKMAEEARKAEKA